MNYISVLTPSFNSGKYLERAISSVVNQKFTNWEHIIVDGGSTDNTLSILRSYPHIRWISEPDRGQSDAMNKAFLMSTGDVIMYLNADDELAENIFSEVHNFFNAFPNRQILIGNLIQIFDDEIILKIPSTKLRDIIEPFKLLFPLNPVSYYYRREVQLSIGKFPLSNVYAMDYWFLLEVYNKYKVYYLDKVFGYFYFTPGNKSSQANKPQNELLEILSNFKKTNNFFFIRLRLINKLKRVLLAH